MLPNNSLKIKNKKMKHSRVTIDLLLLEFSRSDIIAFRPGTKSITIAFLKFCRKSGKPVFTKIVYYGIVEYVFYI
jgi:hypothetical protein